MEIISHLLAISGVLVLVSLLYNLWRVRIVSNKNNGILPPEPSGALPIIGHIHKFLGKIPMFRTMAAMADKHGPTFTFRFGMKRALVISNHEAVKECFTTNDKAFASRPMSSHGKYLVYNYAAFGFAPYGTYWREMRKLVMIELLSSRHLETLKSMRVSEVDTLVKDLYSLCKSNKHNNNQTSLNIITKVIAGKRYFGNDGNDVEAQHIGKIIKDFMYAAGVPVISDLIPFLKWIDLFEQVKFMKRVAKEFDSLVGSWVDEHTTRRVNGDEPSDKLDFIDVMLSKIEENSMFGHTRFHQGNSNGGSDTASINLTWLLSLLLNNQHAQEELDLKVGRERWVEEHDINDLIYLQAIIKESLRLYPPVPLSVPHEAMEDCHVCDYYIPKGTYLFVSVWKLHRDPRVNIFEFIPFGSGRRSCPGSKFAFQVSHLTLACLLQGFEFQTPLNMLVDMIEGLSINLPRATPLEVLLTPRLSSKLYQI
ncbi:hypothetical protein RGQ29_031634 [Quercus rubra]|uniref:Cytochrome P450 n=1 Tax=Quercus rubra TaxID=3512 RepID=A0AAN7EMM6_QUERU|nr:hypothetical protein RGQ29_031634 [Quercus rubra]